MKGREGNYKGGSANSADLLVCFPSRAHLALSAPKPICSPARHSDSHNRRNNIHPRHLHRRHVSKLSGSQASPVLWVPKPTTNNNKQIGGSSDEIAEPTSPKVTCAGQIKVRPSKSAGGGGPNTCKNWQSVMEEIERIHNSRKSQGSKILGFKKDVTNFLTCLRNIRFDFRCFGSFSQDDITTDDGEEEDDEDENDYEEGEEDREQSSRTVFSKWFMVLQENQNDISDVNSNDGFSLKREKKQSFCDLSDVVNGDCDYSDTEPAVPPPNALLLMRCRSAPAKSWLEEKRAEKELEDDKKEKESDNNNDDNEDEEEEKEEGQIQKEKDDEKRKKKKKDLRSLMEEEKMNLVVMRYDTDFYRLSTDIAKETWVVGGIKDPFSRSRSWKR